MSKQRAFVKYTKQGNIIPGSLIVTTKGGHPKDGVYREVSVNLCCDNVPETPGLRFTTIIDNPESQEGFIRFEVVENGGSVDGIIDWGDGTIESINIPDDENTYTFTHEYVLEGTYTGVVTLDSPEKLIQLYFDGND